MQNQDRLAARLSDRRLMHLEVREDLARMESKVLQNDLALFRRGGIGRERDGRGKENGADRAGIDVRHSA